MLSALFQSERLLCRRWLADDFEPLYALYSDPESMRYVGDGQPISRALCEEWFKVTEANYAKRGYGMFTLVHRESDKVAGFAGLVHPRNQPEPEVKYAFLPLYRGKGLV